MNRLILVFRPSAIYFRFAVASNIVSFAELGRKPTYASSARLSDDGEATSFKVTSHSNDQVQSVMECAQAAVVV